MRIVLAALVLIIAPALLWGLIDIYRSANGRPCASFEEIKQKYAVSDLSLIHI